MKTPAKCPTNSNNDDGIDNYSHNSSSNNSSSGCSNSNCFFPLILAMGSKGRGEMLCLRWEDFGTHFSHSFREMRDDDLSKRSAARASFSDVTLVAGDHQVRAHRVVLSSCSPLFRRILARQAEAAGALAALAHPVIFLRGVSAGDLERVLDFMYRGEVSVAHDDLDSFLAAAEELQVKGLTSSSPKKENRKRAADPPPRQPHPPPSEESRKRPRPASASARPKSAREAEQGNDQVSWTQRRACIIFEFI